MELKPDQSQAWMNMGGIQHIKVANRTSFLKSKLGNSVPHCDKWNKKRFMRFALAKGRNRYHGTFCILNSRQTCRYINTSRPSLSIVLAFHNYRIASLLCEWEKMFVVMMIQRPHVTLQRISWDSVCVTLKMTTVTINCCILSHSRDRPSSSQPFCHEVVGKHRSYQWY